MEVTRVEITPIQPKDGLVAFATVYLDDCFMVSSIGIHTNLSRGGYRITYPTKKIGDQHISLFNPTNKELSLAIETAINKKCEGIL